MGCCFDDSTVPPNEEKTPQNGYQDGPGTRSEYSVPETKPNTDDNAKLKAPAPLPIITKFSRNPAGK